MSNSRWILLASLASLVIPSASRVARAQGFGESSFAPEGGEEEEEQQQQEESRPSELTKKSKRAPRFGDVRRCALSGSSFSLDVAFGSYSDSEAKDRYIGGELGVDCFIFDHISLGGFVDASHASNTGYDAGGHLFTATKTSYGAGARIGYDLSFTRGFSLWTRGGIGAFTLGQDGTGPATSYTEHPIGLTASSMLLAHLAPHFFVGFGPRVYIDVARSNDRSSIEHKRLAYGAGLIMGGWL